MSIPSTSTSPIRIPHSGSGLPWKQILPLTTTLFNVFELRQGICPRSCTDGSPRWIGYGTHRQDPLSSSFHIWRMRINLKSANENASALRPQRNVQAADIRPYSLDSGQLKIPDFSCHWQTSPPVPEPATSSSHTCTWYFQIWVCTDITTAVSRYLLSPQGPLSLKETDAGIILFLKCFRFLLFS